MSFNSVDALFKQLINVEQRKTDKFKNDDVPIFNSGGESNTQNISSYKGAHEQLKLDSSIRNGDGYLLPRNTFNPDPYKDEFLTEHSIDPIYIRNSVNPNTMDIPTTGEYQLYGVDPSMKTEMTSLSLLQKARQSYYNYSNRLNPINIPVAPIGTNPQQSAILPTA